MSSTNNLNKKCLFLALVVRTNITVNWIVCYFVSILVSAVWLLDCLFRFSFTQNILVALTALIFAVIHDNATARLLKWLHFHDFLSAWLFKWTEHLSFPSASQMSMGVLGHIISSPRKEWIHVKISKQDHNNNNNNNNNNKQKSVHTFNVQTNIISWIHMQMCDDWNVE